MPGASAGNVRHINGNDVVLITRWAREQKKAVMIRPEAKTSFAAPITKHPSANRHRHVCQSVMLTTTPAPTTTPPPHLATRVGLLVGGAVVVVACAGGRRGTRECSRNEQRKKYDDGTTTTNGRGTIERINDDQRTDVVKEDVSGERVKYLSKSVPRIEAFARSHTQPHFNLTQPTIPQQTVLIVAVVVVE